MSLLRSSVDAYRLSHEEAILARQDLIQENKQKVKSMKEETEKMM